MIGPAFKIRQSHTIKYRVSKFVPQRCGEGNTSPVVLRGSTKRMSIAIEEQLEENIGSCTHLILLHFL